MREFADALDDYLRGRYRVPEPEHEVVETYEVVEDDHRPLEEQDAATLFQAMAARQVRHHRPRRRRTRFRIPEWVIPLALSSVALGAMGYGLWWFVNYLEHRPKPTTAAVTSTTPIDPGQAAEEQRRRAEHEALSAALKKWAEHPSDPAAKRELDGWLDSPTGRRIDLPPEVNLGLGQYLILERDRWDLGLRRLVLSAEGPWRKAAEASLAAAAADAPAAWVSAGDGWWKLADGQAGQSRLRLMDRAGLCYSQAAPRLAGREAERVKRRLKVIDGLRRPA
jgi:hypothetical protein